MGRDRLRIAYLCDMSPLDRNLYSGGNARIFEALQKHAGDVTILPSDWGTAEPLRRLILSTPERVNLRVRWRAHLALRRIIGRRVTRTLRRGQYDVVFGAYSLHSMCGLRVPDGMLSAFTSDATQTVYRCSEVGKAHDRHFPFGHFLDGWVESCEARALRNVDLLLWPSNWLQEAVADRYGIRGQLVSWGANIDTPPEGLSRQLTGRLELLLIGRDWFAKGGPVAFETMQRLRDAGVDAHLTVIGCTPPDCHRNGHVTVHPQLDKGKSAELAIFDAALARAHFLVQPSYESYGFAFCEASAYGLPALCLNVGGVPVWNGVNGEALPVGSGADAFAAVIQSYLDAPARYAVLSRSARETFETRLNWDAWGKSVAELLNEAVTEKRQTTLACNHSSAGKALNHAQTNRFNPKKQAFDR